MALLHSLYNSILCLLFRSQLTQYCCLWRIVCSSDRKAFLEFPKESKRDIKDRNTGVVSSFSSLFIAFYFFLIFICKRVRPSCVCFICEVFEVYLKWRWKCSCFLSTSQLSCFGFCLVLYIKQLLFYFKDLNGIIYRTQSLGLQRTSKLLVVCTKQWCSDFFIELFKDKSDGRNNGRIFIRTWNFSGDKM